MEKKLLLNYSQIELNGIFDIYARKNHSCPKSHLTVLAGWAWALGTSGSGTHEFKFKSSQSNK